ncbi:helix-turn-helix transcriptional regulator [Streptomyces triticirhizae]|uniref:TrmB family transcriptional regulator n=1 Tax=Streptomyces triticirhizae TaxID=2483353 RepID=A0A3M2LNZ3_9ACTN|nr:LuxR family transcriptional regulator [Streptomyces triticirhizae]RMI39149.1 TrmB family transcriptional regulator [Streptomyces triticirhizae]
MLEAAGVTADEEAVYRLLVTVRSATAEEVARRTGRALGEAVGLLVRLERKGLAHRVDDEDGGAFAASAPDVALLPELQRNAVALDRARAAVTDLLDVYRGTLRRHDPGQLIEVVTGAEALRRRIQQVQGNARHEMMWFCKAQYVAMPSESNTEEFAALARGVRYRVLYERAYLEGPGAVDSLVAGVRAGEVARSVPTLPLRMAIADRELAICPLVPGGPQGSPERPTAAVVRGSSLLEALLALFESYWEHGVPLRVDATGAVTGASGEGPGAELSPSDRHLLSLLVAGVTDKAIASQLRLSQRTVQRRVRDLMTATGAATRMQLAWLAARRGLI